MIEQRQWGQAREYFITALQTYVDYSDQYNAQIVLTSLARLHRASGDTTLPTAVAAFLGIPLADAVRGVPGTGDRQSTNA